MNYESFISSRIIHGRDKSITSQPVIRLAIAGIALGVCVMVITIMIVAGFKKQITEKVSVFASHIQVAGFESNISMETSPVYRDPVLLKKINALPAVRNVQTFARKAGILKTETEFEGVVFKGVDSTYDFAFISSHLTEGSLPSLKTDTGRLEALISHNLATRLQLRPGDSFLAYFLENQKKIRKFYISGIYNTGLAEEFDNIYIFCALPVIQKLNNWSDDEVSGLEIYVKDFNKVDEAAYDIYNLAGFELNCRTVREIYPQIFNWLQLQDINVLIIVALMVIVAAINMISTLLIIILENTLTIGILKALGASSQAIRKVFLRVAFHILGKGLMAGNVIALLLCYLQYKFQIISLPQESYYVSSVPVAFSLTGLIAINAGTIVICMIMLIIPSGIISRLSPAKVIQFE